MIEFLEARIAPATLISPKAISYTDTDGDAVTVKLSKAVLTEANAATVFVFNSAFTDTTAQQLQSINLATLSSDGISVKLVAKASGGNGDGFAAVGEINSSGFAVGKVKLDGDLGRISAGSSAPVAVKSLTVISIGRYSTATQVTGGTLDSTFTGDVGKIAAKQDIRGANIDINGRLGGLAIAGSLIGTSLDAERGVIAVSGDIGKIKVGKHIIGGDSSSANASITAGGTIGNVSVRGSIVASATSLSQNARLSAEAFGPIKIGGDLRGGQGSNSGAINASVNTGSVAGKIEASSETDAIPLAAPTSGGIIALRIGGSIIGGTGTSSGTITADGIGGVKISGDIRGGEGISSGGLTVTTLRSLAVGGSVVGDDGDRSGVVFVGGDSGKVKISGDIRGGLGLSSGRVEARGVLASVALGGSLVGGDILPLVPVENGPVVESVPVLGGSGQIISGGDMGRIKIGHDVVGGDADDSGKIASAGKLAGLTIRGSVVGGAGDQIASISAGADGFAIASQISSVDDMGPVKIGHDVRGGDGIGGGHIYTDGALASISMGGSLRGGTATQTGRISADETIGVVKMRGGIFGGAGAESGAVVTQATIGSMTIGLDLASGNGIGSGHIGAQTIGTLKIAGAVIGNEAHTAVISATGTANPSNDTAAVAIRSVSIGGRIELGQILAGADETGTITNADAQIGTIAIGGDWVRSDASAGVLANGEGGFGTADDTLAAGGGSVLAKIARITIKGQILGTPESQSATDHYGIVAEQVGFVSVGGTAIDLQFGPHNDAKDVGVTGDVTIREV
jgi:hypothetical protein